MIEKLIDILTSLMMWLRSHALRIYVGLRPLLERCRRTYYSIHFTFKRLIADISDTVFHIVDGITIVAGLWCIGNIIYQVGFHLDPSTHAKLFEVNRRLLYLFAAIQIIKLLRYLLDRGMPHSVAAELKNILRKGNIKGLYNYLFVGNRIPFNELLYALGTFLYCYYMPPEGTVYGNWHDLLWHQYTKTALLFFLSVNEMSRILLGLLGKRTHPSILFVLSFLAIILVGTVLLLMPKCSIEGLSFFDALFTATTVVCVNGLSIVNIATELTTFGQVIVMILMQIGGIGVMTFTCFFALSLTGQTSLSNRQVIKDLVSADSMTDILRTLKRIVYVTIIIELISAYLIFVSIDDQLVGWELKDKVFCAAFHAISAFCNAGLSTIDGGLTNPLFIDMRVMQVIIGCTVLLGGMGFPMQSGVIDYCKHHITHFFLRIFNSQRRQELYRSRLINASNRLMFYAHLTLMVVGVFIFMITEANSTQAGQSFFERLSSSFFLSTNSRTAGFLTIDPNQLSTFSLLALVGLMWIGCAPLSTGGGIKVTTFALAILNVRAVLRGQDTINIFGRQVSKMSVRRAYAVMFISVFILMLCAVLMKSFDPTLPFKSILVESCSALCTGGISLGITEQLSLPSQIVVLIEMFVGRIGILSFLMCFVSPADKLHYKYPTETIMI